MVEGALGWQQVQRAGILAFALCGLLAVPLIALRGLPMLTLGLLGVAGGYLYCGGPKGYKYLALGDLFIFLLFGPLMTLGAYLALTGLTEPGAALVAVPVGLLVTAILAANNLRDIRDDSAVGVHTVATVLGHSKAAWEYAGLLALAYLLLPVLAAAGALPWTAMAALLTAPLALKNAKAVLRSRPGDPVLDLMDQRSAQLQLAFGLVLAVSTALGRLG